MDKFSGMQLNRNDSNLIVNQDVSEYIKYAKESREAQLRGDASHYRSFAIIPDIVAIDILTKHGLNLLEEGFMGNPADVAKLKRIIKSEHPDLLTSNISRARG
tara:strand:- start:585 stop:893 length:309 start_codon:yes stop_codon:yes gene_type:complete